MIVLSLSPSSSPLTLSHSCPPLSSLPCGSCLMHVLNNINLTIIPHTQPTSLSLSLCLCLSSLNNFSSQYGQTALHCASIRGQTDVVKMLVDYGAQIDNKGDVSTEPCIRLNCDSSITISISPSLFLPPALVSLSPLSPVNLALVMASLF